MPFSSSQWQEAHVLIDPGLKLETTSLVPTELSSLDLSQSKPGSCLAMCMLQSKPGAIGRELQTNPVTTGKGYGSKERRAHKLLLRWRAKQLFSRTGGRQKEEKSMLSSTVTWPKLLSWPLPLGTSILGNGVSARMTPLRFIFHHSLPHTYWG